MRGLAVVGPIELDILDASFSWTGTPNDDGTRGAALGGMLPWYQTKQLQELVGNPHRAVTIGAETGVLEYVWSGDRYLADFTGWYLLQAVAINSTVEHSNEDDAIVVFNIAAVYVGAHRQVVVPRSARARVNTQGLAGAELLAAPLTVSDGNPAFTANPGGTTLEREFDAAHGDDLYDESADGRVLQLRTAAIGTIAELVLPTVEDTGVPPAWIGERGGDCRAYDMSEGRAVYGPSHPLAEPSDLVIENGLLRAWCGPRGVVPYFAVAAFADGAWRQVGCVALADETAGPILDRARLVEVTPDRVTAALSIRTVGEVHVTLQRGERMLRIQHGTTRIPTVSTTRRVVWLGTPPTTDGIGDAVSGPGEFGGGIDLTSDLPMFQWPVAVTQDAWTVRGSWIPTDGSADQAPSGMWALLAGDDLVTAATLWWSDDGTFHLEVGDNDVVTAPMSFDAGDVVSYVARFDTTRGLALSVATPSAVGRVADSSALTPVSSDLIRRMAMWAGPADPDVEWGDDDWGDGVWGGALAPAGGADELLVFAGRVTDDQADELLLQTAQLADLPSTPRPVWYAAFDDDITPVGDAAASGRRVESASDGNGFKRFVASLTAVTGVDPVGARTPSPATAAAFAAGLATTATEDTAADQHDQLAAASTQETRIR